MEIGFIGLGVMGSRMTKRLMDADLSATVYNRTKEKMEPFVNDGAHSAETIAELARDTNVICTCLSMPEDVIEVYEGSEGILENAKVGTICLDFTTVGIDTSRRLAETAKEKNIVYLDAPISGGPEGAEAGTLTIMVGGDDVAFQKVRHVLSELGENVQHLGASGMGTVAKLMNQYLVAVHSLAASEAMVAGTALGLKSEQLYDILKSSYGNSHILRRHMEQYVLTRDFAPGGAVKYVHKDVKLANELMNQVNIQQFTGHLAETAFQHAIDEGLGNEDMSAIIKPLEQQGQTTVGKQE